MTGGHVLAANVDLALVTEPLPDPKARRLERFAALAASGGVPTALVLTKTDLADDGWETAARLARRLGVADAVAISALTGEGLNVVRSLLAPGTTAVLLGASGTGKSTLVNALLGRGAPEDQRRPRERPARAPHDRHPRAADAARRRVPDRHAGHPRRRPVGRHRRQLRRRRHAGRELPVRGLRPRHRAGLRRPRRARPGADRRLAQAPARAGVGRRPARGHARTRPAPQGDHALPADPREGDPLADRRRSAPEMKARAPLLVCIDMNVYNPAVAAAVLALAAAAPAQAQAPSLSDFDLRPGADRPPVRVQTLGAKLPRSDVDTLPRLRGSEAERRATDGDRVDPAGRHHQRRRRHRRARGAARELVRRPPRTGQGRPRQLPRRGDEQVPPRAARLPVHRHRRPADVRDRRAPAGGIHAGGIVWHGNLLYVVDTTRGIRVFDMRQIFELERRPTRARSAATGRSTTASATAT